MIILFLLVLFTGSAWAEVGSLKDCTKNGVSIDCKSILVPLPEEIQQAGGNPCFAKMETAMRSVEEYLNTFLVNEQQKIVGLVFTPYGLKEFERKMDTWNRVADECWRQP